MQKRLYAQREMLKSKVVIPDEPETEPQVDVIVSAEDNEPMSMVQQEPCIEENAQESNDCQKTDGLVEDVRTSRNDQKSQKSENDIDESYAKMRTVIDEIITVQDEDGNRFVLHPASSNEIVGVDKNGNVTEYLDSDLILYPDTPENEARKESLNRYEYSPRLMAIMTVIEDKLTLSPIAFLGPPTRLFGMRQALYVHIYRSAWSSRFLWILS